MQFKTGILLLFTFLTALCFAGYAFALTSVSFGGNLTVAGSAPVITAVEQGVSVDPLEGSTRTFYLYFNVSDSNGYDDINYTAAHINISHSTNGGEQSHMSSTCVAQVNGTLTMLLNCTLTLEHYELNGTWDILAYVQDLSSLSDTNDSYTLSYNPLSAVTSPSSGVEFGSVSLGAASAATTNPFVLNNTGNQNFSTINVTAYNFVGAVDSGEQIDASNFTANATGTGIGDRLANATAIQLTNASLPRDSQSSDFDENIRFWVELPSTGLSTQRYDSYASWVVEVFT